MSMDNLNEITDRVLSYKPNKTTLSVIAGAADKPLEINGVEISCFVLEDETRVLTQSSMFSGLGLARRGLVTSESGAQLPRFAASKSINPFINKDLMDGLTTPIVFKINGTTSYGFPATMLVDICDAVLSAREAGMLNWQQRELANRCDLLIRGLAKVGIIALVDEATGYQRIREERALASILEKFIAKEVQPWTRTFPYEFYNEIFRLKDWAGPIGVKRPSVIGKYTNNIVYQRLAPGVLEELKNKNPKLPQGTRRHKHHQWFTSEFGHPKLKEHLSGVMALMRIASSWRDFLKKLDVAFPRYGHTKTIRFDEEDD